MKSTNSIIKYIGWFVSTSFVYFQFLIQTSSSIMQKDWAQFFHLDPLGVSLLSAAFFYTYLLFQIPVGVIYDRYNAKKVLAITSFGLGVSCILFACTHSYAFAMLARMLMGACAAFGFIGMLKVTANYFPGKQFSLMMGFSESFAAVATMLGVMFLAWSINHTSWRMLMIYFAFGIFLISVSVLIFVQSQENNEASAVNFSLLLKNVVSASTNSTVLVSGIYGFFMFAVINCFNSLWGVAFLNNAYSMSNELAAQVMSTVFLGLAVGCPINGYFSKHYGLEREAMQVCSILCALSMAIILYLKVPVFMLYVLFFIVGLMCSIYVQAFAIVGEAVPLNIQATSMGVTNMLIMLSAPVLQIFVGAVLDSHSFGFANDVRMNYQIALSILPVGMVVAFGLCFFVKRN